MLKFLILWVLITILKPTGMPFELPKLPYAADALAPYISKQTIDFHYGKASSSLCE